MKVAVFGSLREEAPLGPRTAEFERACKLIGERLAKDGHELIICSANPCACDRHIFEGYKDLAKVPALLVREVRSDPARTQLVDGNPGKVVALRGAPAKLLAAVSVAVDNSEIVLAIAGGQHTEFALRHATKSRRPIILVRAFGGTARIWQTGRRKHVHALRENDADGIAARVGEILGNYVPGPQLGAASDRVFRHRPDEQAFEKASGMGLSASPGIENAQPSEVQLGAGDGGAGTRAPVWDRENRGDPKPVAGRGSHGPGLDAIIETQNRLARDGIQSPVMAGQSTLDDDGPSTSDSDPESTQQETRFQQNRTKAGVPAPIPPTRLFLKVDGDTRTLKVGDESISWEVPPGILKAARFGPDKKESLASAKVNLALNWTRAQVVGFGAELADLLLGPEPKANVLAAFNPQGLTTRRLVLDLDPASACFPWEYLNLGGKFLFEQRLSVVRHVPAGPEMGRPLRLARLGTLAIASANPDRDFKDADHLGQTFRGLHGYDVRPISRCTRADLVRLLETKPDGFHFLGHGKQGRLQLEKCEGQEDHWVTADRLTPLLATTVGSYVFLGACESGATRDGGSEFGGIAESIVAKTGLPTIAMQLVVPRDYSTGFAVAFYENLRKSQDLEAAVHAARHFAFDARAAFGIPVLFADVDRADDPPAVEPIAPEAIRFQPIEVRLTGEVLTKEQVDRIAACLEEQLRPTLQSAGKEAMKGGLRVSSNDSASEIARKVLRAAGVAETKQRPILDNLQNIEAPPPPSVVQGPLELLGDVELRPDWTLVQNERFKAISERFSFSRELISRVLAELFAGRHVLLTGPVGSGKTTLAQEITKALGYDLLSFTATAEWSAFDVVGGHWPTPVDGGDGVTRMDLAFRSGAVVEAILANWHEASVCEDQPRAWRRSWSAARKGTWVLLDELNRADIDRAMGALFTALDTRRLRVPAVSKKAGAVASVEIPMPEDFRIFATINGADRHYLFRLSDALKRRFAFIEVPVTEDWNGEWSRVGTAGRAVETEESARTTETLLEDFRRFVYLCRLFHPVGTGPLKAGRKLLESSRGSGMESLSRLDQAIAGSVLPQIEALPESLLEVLGDWCRGEDEQRFVAALEGALGQASQAMVAAATQALAPPEGKLAKGLWRKVGGVLPVAGILRERCRQVQV